MVNQILRSAGFRENETYKETRFIKPPKETYCVFLDSVTRRGADDANLIAEHDFTIELYSYIPDPEAEARIEAALDARAIPYDKAARYWLNEEQLYQVVYEFSNIVKGGI